MQFFHQNGRFCQARIWAWQSPVQCIINLGSYNARDLCAEFDGPPQTFLSSSASCSDLRRLSATDGRPRLGSIVSTCSRQSPSCSLFPGTTCLNGLVPLAVCLRFAFPTMFQISSVVNGHELDNALPKPRRRIELLRLMPCQCPTAARTARPPLRP